MQPTEQPNTKEMINWSFKCLGCEYSFKALEPKEFYDSYDSCAMYGSKNYEKKLMRKDEPSNL